MKFKLIVRIVTAMTFLFVTYAYANAQSFSMGNACRFIRGIRSGEIQDYSQLPMLPIDSPCQDGQGSSGVVVVLKDVPIGKGNACNFDAGPRAGQTKDYSQMPNGSLGESCHDGQGSTGRIVLLKSKSEIPPVRGMVKSCNFYLGPRSGQSKYFSQFSNMSVGAACNDEEGNYGRVTILQRIGSDSSHEDFIYAVIMNELLGGTRPNQLRFVDIAVDLKIIARDVATSPFWGNNYFAVVMAGQLGRKLQFAGVQNAGRVDRRVLQQVLTDICPLYPFCP